MTLEIKLNSSEALAFSGCFGLIFALPNLYQIFIQQVFPIIIETATSNVGLFKFLYVVLLIFITIETYYWIIQLANMVQKTQRIHRNFNLYLAKVFFFGVLGFAVAVILNNWLF